MVEFKIVFLSELKLAKSVNLKMINIFRPLPLGRLRSQRSLSTHFHKYGDVRKFQTNVIARRRAVAVTVGP